LVSWYPEVTSRRDRDNAKPEKGRPARDATTETTETTNDIAEEDKKK